MDKSQMHCAKNEYITYAYIYDITTKAKLQRGKKKKKKPDTELARGKE